MKNLLDNKYSYKTNKLLTNIINFTIKTNLHFI
jgi:hypothetical protein